MFDFVGMEELRLVGEFAKNGNYAPFIWIGAVYTQKFLVNRVEAKKSINRKYDKKIKQFVSNRVSEIVDAMYLGMEGEIADIVNSTPEDKQPALIEVRRLKDDSGAENYKVFKKSAAGFLAQYYKEGKNYAHNDFYKTLLMYLGDDKHEYMKEDKKDAYIERNAIENRHDINTHMRKRMGLADCLIEIEEQFLTYEFFYDNYKSIIDYAASMEVERKDELKWWRR